MKKKISKYIKYIVIAIVIILYVFKDFIVKTLTKKETNNILDSIEEEKLKEVKNINEDMQEELKTEEQAAEISKEENNEDLSNFSDDESILNYINRSENNE